nr:DUF1259 domain-containing protein [Paraflavitalea speifideiaquila]
MKLPALLLSGLIVHAVSCSSPVLNDTATTTEAKKDTISCPPGSSKLNIQTIEQVTGMKGVEKNGEYKITVPQHDLHVTVDGFKIIPPMGLGSWAAFTPVLTPQW